MTSTVDVVDFVDKHKISRFQIHVLIITCLVMFLDGFDSQAIGFVVPDIVAKWGVPKGEFGPVFAGGLLGLALGPLLFGFLADRVGRKPMIVVCLACFGIFTLAKVLATTVSALLLLQFVAGLFCGGAMPNAFALINEYSPLRRRGFMVMLAGCGFSFGATVVGLLASRLLPIYGWQSIFYVGGILPLVLVLWTAASLPESIRFMALFEGQRERLIKTLSKIDAGLTAVSSLRLISSEKKVKGVPVVHLLTGGRAGSTLLLWIASFMDFVIIYFVMSWLPIILTDSGFSMADAAFATSWYPTAGVIAGAGIGRLMDRFGSINMLALSFAIAAVFLTLLGYIGGATFLVVCSAVAAAGFFAIGGHFGISALAGELYPTYMRSTGVGWAMGIGRFCSLISPIMGGWLIASHWQHSSLFLVVAAAALLCAVAIFLIRLARVAEAPPSVAFAEASTDAQTA